MPNEPNGDGAIAKRDWTIALALGPPAIALRLIAIGQEAFWSDEIASLLAVLEGVIPHITAREGSPPLFFYLLKGWSLIFGQSHAALRGFSAVVGGLCVPALYLCARRWRFGAVPSLVAALILAFNPMAYWYSQQNRYNSLLVLFVIMWISTLPAFAAARRGIRPIVAYTLAGFACFATHYYFIFSGFGWAAGYFAWWLLGSRDRSILLRFVWSNVALLALMALLFPLLFAQMGNNPVAWLGPPTAGQFFSVYTAMYWVGPWAIAGAWRSTVIAALSIASVGGILTNRFGGSRADETIQMRAWLLFALFFFPAAVTYLISISGYPVFLADRYTFPFLPPFILWIVAGWEAWPVRTKRWILAAGLAGCMLIAIPSIRDYWRKYQHFNWFRAISVVDESWREGDVMIFSPDWLRDGLDYNGGRARNVVPSHRPAEADGAARIWLFMWEFSPEESTRNALRSLRESHDSELLIDQGIQTLTLVHMGEAPASGRATGFYGTENWNGEIVRWSRGAAAIPIDGRPASVPFRYWVGHPDPSAGNPVVVEISVNGSPVATLRHDRQGFYGEEVSLPEAVDNALRLEIEVSPTWTSPEGRELGIGVYWPDWAAEKFSPGQGR